jgi:hypothetical protein
VEKLGSFLLIGFSFVMLFDRLAQVSELYPQKSFVYAANVLSKENIL